VSPAEPEVSVVIPCLNEARTVGVCVRQAMDALIRYDILGEVILADNGSGDDSRERAVEAGARLVSIPEKGYGRALMGGVAASRGRYIIMGDADGSYDFGELPRFVAKMREGCDLVQGCRFPKGGGRIESGAMPFMHRRIGNPALSLLARLMFRTPINDVYCGLRGFTRSFFDRADLRCTGMEFATEMIIKAAQLDVRTAEVPITLHCDGRKGQASHLRTFRDGWRTLRLFLLCSPDWLFLIPGVALIGSGLFGSILGLAASQIGPATLGMHSVLVSCMLLLVGTQTCFLAIFAHTFAMVEGLRPSSAFIVGFYRIFNLEKAFVGAGIIAVAGLALIAVVYFDWRAGGYGSLDYAHTLKLVIPGVTLVALSAQIVFGSFMVSILGLDRK
jgi:hypothetical protein